jgi:hypothetical protein
MNRREFLNTVAAGAGAAAVASTLVTEARAAAGAAAKDAITPAVSLAGVIDCHCHTAPDVMARSVTDFELARLARAAGMRAIVLKNHYTMTADRAQTVMREAGGLEVFGGIALNRSVGGLNAEAVRRMVAMEGHRGKIVWLPTFDAENQVRFSHENRPFVAIVRDGRPVPELAEIFQLAAQHDLVLATGHSSADESLVVLAAARAAGVKRTVVTHVLSETIGATPEHLRKFAALGATMECVWLTHFSRGGEAVNVGHTIPVAKCANAIRTVGAEHFLIASDFGQANNPPHPEGIRAFIAALQAEGVTAAEIDQVARQNPARLLGLG